MFGGRPWLLDVYNQAVFTTPQCIVRDEYTIRGYVVWYVAVQEQLKQRIDVVVRVTRDGHVYKQRAGGAVVWRCEIRVRLNVNVADCQCSRKI